MCFQVPKMFRKRTTGEKYDLPVGRRSIPKNEGNCCHILQRRPGSTKQTRFVCLQVPDVVIKYPKWKLAQGRIFTGPFKH